MWLGRARVGWFRRIFGSTLCLALSTALVAHAAPPASAATDEDVLTRAKRLFHEGVLLLRAGDVERALVYFLQSRELVPSDKNTANAAICLDRLGRYDEALELYEQLLTRFAAELDDEDRAVIGPAMAALREKVGSIDISSNVEGLVVVDGRARGKLPLETPVRVLGGPHVVRVTKDGYAPFEVPLEVQVGRVERVDLKLTALEGVGLLRVEDASDAGADVYVDGVRVGKSPWEGTVGAGPHVVWTRRRERGSAPAVTTIVEGQTALVRAASNALGPKIVVRGRPSSAAVSIDGVALGHLPWAGRLPVGTYRLSLSEEGYHPVRRELVVPAAGDAIVVTETLRVDRTHPRWPGKRTRATLGVRLGYLGGPTVGSGAEGACPEQCDGNPMVHGFIAGARGGVDVAPRFTLDVEGGYMWIGASFDQRASDEFQDNDQPFTVARQMEHSISIRGPYSGVGASYRLPLGPATVLALRTQIGVLFASAGDDLSGTITTTSEPMPALVSGADERVSAIAPFIAPEVGVERALGPLRGNLSLSMPIFPLAGPRYSGHEVGVDAECQEVGSAGCAPVSDQFARTRAYGAFTLFSVGLAVGRDF